MSIVVVVLLRYLLMRRCNKPLFAALPRVGITPLFCTNRYIHRWSAVTAVCRVLAFTYILLSLCTFIYLKKSHTTLLYEDEPCKFKVYIEGGPIYRREYWWCTELPKCKSSFSLLSVLWKVLLCCFIDSIMNVLYLLTNIFVQIQSSHNTNYF